MATRHCLRCDALLPDDPAAEELVRGASVPLLRCPRCRLLARNWTVRLRGRPVALGGARRVALDPAGFGEVLAVLDDAARAAAARGTDLDRLRPHRPLVVRRPRPAA